MFRSSFIIIIVLCLCMILKVCSSAEPTVSKRVQKCRWYSPHVYLLGTPTCKISPKKTQAIEIQEFPHIAIIGYRYRNDDAKVYWHGHGTLVSSRYVLTTGYCAKNSIKVRLGVNSIGSPYKSSFSSSNSSDYDIENNNVHPLYREGSVYNNVGLIKLSRKVKFSENVRPICLPDRDFKPSTVYQVYYDESTEYQNTIPVQKPLAVHEQRLEPNEQCNEKFSHSSSRELQNGITNELMCSLQPTNLPNYTLRGQVGAPLYIDHPDLTCSHIQLGVASLPSYFTLLPELATKVFDIMDWIESVIWADGEDF